MSATIDTFVEHDGAYNGTLRRAGRALGVVVHAGSFQGKRKHFANFVHYSQDDVRAIADNCAKVIVAEFL